MNTVTITQGLIVLAISFCLLSTAHADTLVLQSGEIIQGQIIEQTDLRVTVDVQGAPYTFYLGEIASIDGRPVEMPQEKVVEKALVEEKAPPVVPYYNDEQDSLERFMKIREGDTSPVIPPTVQKPLPSPISVPSATSSPAPEAPKVPAPDQSVLTSIPRNTNRSVVTTPDGGIIVIDNDKIIKYDKDLQVIRQVSLTDPAPVTALPPVAMPAPTPPAAAPAVSQEPETLKEFLHNVTVDLTPEKR